MKKVIKFWPKANIRAPTAKNKQYSTPKVKTFAYLVPLLHKGLSRFKAGKKYIQLKGGTAIVI